ncbi:MAG TPA: hypothetical protein VMF11_13775 [Candidatus Baltobacteraceae bacterium]|nr:hypothetical protein [Candidatus Baltobacteraceae bacterium]
MLTLRNLIAGSAFAVFAVAIAACGGGGTTIQAPTPGPTCSPGEAVQMVYPIPGATGVTDNPQQFVFAVASPLPNTWNAYINTSDSLSGSVQTYAGMETIPASNVPSPSATPSISNPYYQSITLTGGFSSGETIYVWLNNESSNCTPLGPVGSFTTQ